MRTERKVVESLSFAIENKPPDPDSRSTVTLALKMLASSNLLIFTILFELSICGLCACQSVETVQPIEQFRSQLSEARQKLTEASALLASLSKQISNDPASGAVAPDEDEPKFGGAKSESPSGENVDAPEQGAEAEPDERQSYMKPIWNKLGNFFRPKSDSHDSGRPQLKADVGKVNSSSNAPIEEDPGRPDEQTAEQEASASSNSELAMDEDANVGGQVSQVEAGEELKVEELSSQREAPGTVDGREEQEQTGGRQVAVANEQLGPEPSQMQTNLMVESEQHIHPEETDQAVGPNSDGNEAQNRSDDQQVGTDLAETTTHLDSEHLDYEPTDEHSLRHPNSWCRNSMQVKRHGSMGSTEVGWHESDERELEFSENEDNKLRRSGRRGKSASMVRGALLRGSVGLRRISNKAQSNRHVQRNVARFKTHAFPHIRSALARGHRMLDYGERKLDGLERGSRDSTRSGSARVARVAREMRGQHRHRCSGSLTRAGSPTY